VLSVESMVEQTAVRIQLVEDIISVALMTRREHYDFPFLLHFLEEGNGIRSDIEANFKGKAVNIDGKLDIRLTLILLKAMNERLIKV
jgi:hypothetical protein